MIISRFHPDVGGTEKACQRLASKLRGLYDITILTEYREGLPAYEVIDGIPVYRYIKGWHLFEITYMLSVVSFLVRHGKHIDGILCFGLYLFTAPAVLFCRCMRKKIFFRLSSSRETGDFHRIAQLTSKGFILSCARRAHGAIAMTREIENELLQHGFSKERIHRIPNAVDTELFVPASDKPENPFTICYVGRLTHGKGLETMLKALNAFKARTDSFRVFIVGTGELKASVLHQIEKYGLQTFVTCPGTVDNVVPYYQQAHVFVLPSHSEGMPLSLLEAMACGTCVIAAPVGGISDIIHEKAESASEEKGYCVYKNGILCAPGDDSAVTEALVMLMHNPPLRASLSRNARATVESMYPLKNVILRYRDLFKHVRNELF